MNAYDLKMNEVEITDEYFKNALQKEIEYLKAYDADRLLAGFMEVKGNKPKAMKYPGWESTEIRGHSMGHYLTAVSQAYAQTGDLEIKERIDYIVSGLAQCQLESGYLSAFPETFFDSVEQKKPCWVPWYTMDKIIAGLTSAYVLAKNEQAFEVVKKLGDWVYSRTSRWTQEIQATVLAVEYGGMNEAMYDLYRYTKDEKHEMAAHAFDEMSLFEALYNKNDILNGKHANTTIPKFLGALYRYIVRGMKEEDKFYYDSVVNFFDTVVENHSYITGGNSEWEHFGEPKILDGERTNCNCETCNTYNMLKMARELFKITGERKYADFYENTFMNAIMSSQNPETGMTMYFQPMATGYFKVYSTPFDSFWCCTGTGMENFTKCNDSIYFKKDDTIYVNQFISSKVHTADIEFEQISTIPQQNSTTFSIGRCEKNMVLAIRIPDWATEKPSALSVIKNKEIYIYTIKDGVCKGDVCEDITLKIEDEYLYIGGLSEDDEATLTFEFAIKAYGLPDNEHTISLKYGPVVLSAALGREDMAESKTGVDVTIPTRNMTIKDFITVENEDIDDFIKNIDRNTVRLGEEVAFSLRGTDSDKLVFTPHFMQHKERYGMYWNIVNKDSEALQKHIKNEKNKSRLEKASIDSIPLGNDQYELLHNIKGENTGAGTFGGLQLRHAWSENGWFSYDMKVEKGVKNYLLAKYFGPNAGRTFNIYVDGELLCEETIEDVNHGDFYDKKYEIPEKYLQKESINVKFAVRGDSWVGGVFDKLCIVKDYPTETGLTAVDIKGGEIKSDFTKDTLDYSIDICENINSIDFVFTLSDPDGLVYVDGILVDDTQPRKIEAKSGRVIEVKTYGADFETSKTYTFTLR